MHSDAEVSTGERSRCQRERGNISEKRLKRFGNQHMKLSRNPTRAHILLLTDVYSCALQLYPLTTIIFIGSTFTETVSHIMLMHICDEKLNFSGRFSAYLTLLLPIHLYFDKYHNPNPLLNSNLDLISEVFSNFEYYFSSAFQKIEEKNLLIGLTIFSVFFTGIKLYLVSNDLYCDS